jgi:hypothetical protein
MTTDPDDLEFDFDLERSRAVVAVACLQWLECKGPAIEPDQVAPRHNDPSVSFQPIPEPSGEPIHPLWDRWLDG